MQATSEDRSHPAQTAVVTVATLAALVLLGLVLAHWTWTWFAPRPESRAQAAAQAGSRPVDPAQDAHSLFGGAGRKGNVATSAAGGIHLLGIVAASGGRSGYAVLRVDGKQVVAIAEGAEVAPGLRLAEVHVDHIVLERQGGRENLAWPKKAGK